MNISIFKNMTSKLPLPGLLEGVANLIRTDEKIKAFTASYRQTGSKTFKSECPLFAVACTFEGGKGQENIKQLTGLSLVDFDHINQSTTQANQVSPPMGETEERTTKYLAALKAKINADPHTLMCYTTISGNGLRVIYKYELPKEAEQQDVTLRSSFYQQAFFAGNAYYERLLGIKSDAQCKNVTRLSGLAHDPEVFLRPESEAVAFTMEEITKEATAYAKQSKEDKQLHRIQTYYDTLIAPQLAKDNIQFAPGSHNDYVMRVGYKLAERRFSKKVAIKWAKQQFAAYADTEQVFTSCFANATPKGNATGGTNSKADTKTATVDEIKSFLDTHIKLRYNEITTRIEYLETDKQSEKCNQWLPINDRKVNSLWAEMSTITRVNKQDLYSIIESDYVPPFNPFKDYFARLTQAAPQAPPQQATPQASSQQGGVTPHKQSQLCCVENQARGSDAPDYLEAQRFRATGRSGFPLSPEGERVGVRGGALFNGKEGRGDFRKESQSPFEAIHELAQTVTVKGGATEQLRWEHYLKKWLVAMVASWLSNDTVNNVILVLIGEQGAFKTTWFNYLLPPELKQYFYTKTNANRMSKDDLLTLAQYALVCCEELDTMRPSELNQLKAVVTMPSIDERAAYAHYHEHRQHIASFCGTGNNPQFLSDPTGNRRWLPFEVEHIVSPREHPFNYDAIYAEAYALYKSGFKYWFEKEEIQELNKHNREFETPHLEKELVDLYFRKPGPAEAGEFMSVARALQIISAGISQKLSAVNVGRAFVELGFERVRTRSSRGFIVVSRTSEDMKAYQCAQLHDAEPDTTEAAPEVTDDQPF